MHNILEEVSRITVTLGKEISGLDKEKNLGGIFQVEQAYERYCKLSFLFIISRTSMLLKARDMRLTAATEFQTK